AGAARGRKAARARVARARRAGAPKACSQHQRVGPRGGRVLVETAAQPPAAGPPPALQARDGAGRPSTGLAGVLWVRRAGARGPRGVASPALPAPPADWLSGEPSSGSASDPPSLAERRMRGPGRPLLLGLLLVLGAAGPGRGIAETREAADRQTLLQLIVEIVQELRKYHSGESKRLQLSGRQDYTLGRREVSDYGAYAEEQRVEIVPRDLRMKDKFLKHLTGPLYFSPKCSKHFHRLYHNTRDCTIP
ncbi:hypothetical protein DBR06_SOUSAS16610004, partial [Sousa chinensis]